MTGSGLLVFEFSSLGAAYQAVHRLPNEAEVIDLIPGATESTVLVSGAPAILATWQKSAELQEARAHLISSLSSNLMNAHLGLSHPALDRSLGIFEGKTVIDTWIAAEQLDRQGCHVFDLRVLRGSRTGSYLLATGDLSPWQGQGVAGRWTHIENPAKPLADYFDVAPLS